MLIPHHTITKMYNIVGVPSHFEKRLLKLFRIGPLNLSKFLNMNKKAAKESLEYL